MSSIRQSHESYGVISFSRIGGQYDLFDCPIRTNGAVELNISRATALYRDSGTDLSEDESLIRVRLSATQFATLLTCMNQGVGNACTIVRVGKETMEDPPHEDVANTMAREATRATEKVFEKTRQNLALAISQLAEECERPTPRKAVLKEVQAKIVLCRQILDVDAKYYGQVMSELAESATQRVKAEAFASLEAGIRQLGVETLREQRQAHTLILETE